MTEMDSFDARATLALAGRSVDIFRLGALTEKGVGDVALLPYSIRILLENLLRHEDGSSVHRDDIEAVAKWSPRGESVTEIAFRPARVLLQDFTGVPAVVDLAAMRQTVARIGGDPKRINPLQPVDLVIDHSVQVDHFGDETAFERNVAREFQRNHERYQFLKWGQSAFENMRVVPPGTGIVHQVNLEYLARSVFTKEEGGRTVAYPDSLVGTDSHTTMINGLGVLGWGVGGIEAEAAMLGQPITMLLPKVVGFRLKGRLAEGITATDAVLTITEMLRAKGVVGKFVEFFGEGMRHLSLPDRATIANMAPEYGATMGYFPVDEETIQYLRLSGRDENEVRLIEEYFKAQGLFLDESATEPQFSDVLELDLSTVQPSLAGPRRPQDRVALRDAKKNWGGTQQELRYTYQPGPGKATVERGGVEGQSESFELSDGAVVIAAITSCTNTSNPAVMLAAGLVARKAVALGLRSKPWVKTSLAPGSQVVTEYLRNAGLLGDLETLGFHIVGYGCTTCIGNSGPLAPEIEAAIKDHGLLVTSVLSGNRNFEGRVSPLTRGNYLASPPLVIAYALAGTLNINLLEEAIGQDTKGNDVFLKDVWPTTEEVHQTVADAVKTDDFVRLYGEVLQGPKQWADVASSAADTFEWDESSTYIRRPTFFDDVRAGEPAPLTDLRGARALCLLGDSVTTDHISPAGSIAADGPAARYLRERGVEAKDFNSYGSRRGNHEIMMRGTFANIRLRNLLAPGTEGGITRHIPSAETMSIFDAAERYRSEGVPLIVLAGKEYGTGSSRDWAAKGPMLLGVRAVIAESYERIHRSNLIGMGILPLEFLAGESAASHGLTGEELYEIEGLADGLSPRKRITVRAGEKSFEVVARIDTPQEVDYHAHGGILHYVLRQLAKE